MKAFEIVLIDGRYGGAFFRRLNEPSERLQAVNLFICHV